MKALLLTLLVVIFAACASPTAPPSKIPPREAPTQASFGRYILISGVWVWCAECEESGG